MKFLIHCPSLTILTIQDYDCLWDIPDGDEFLRGFVEEGDHGVICPQPASIKLTGNIMFSLETLRYFSTENRGDIPMPNVMPWKKVLINTCDTNYVPGRPANIGPRFAEAGRRVRCSCICIVLFT